MVQDNPLLGPQWEELAKAIVLVLDATPNDRTFCIQTYALKYGLQTGTSPYFQGAKDDFGSFFIEIAANLTCDPKLTEEEFKMMEFLGWDLPAVTTDEFQDQEFGSEANNCPNFERRYSDDVPREEIAEAILEALVIAYGLTEEDFFNFGPPRRAEMIAKNTSLGRLKILDTNPFGEIFALPGQHLDMLGDDPEN